MPFSVNVMLVTGLGDCALEDLAGAQLFFVPHAVPDDAQHPADALLLHDAATPTAGVGGAVTRNLSLEWHTWHVPAYTPDTSASLGSSLPPQ